MHNQKVSFVLYGGDYNPDQWDDSVIDRDMEYFHKAGVNTVTLPVFSWAKLEPREDVYQFEWLDKIIAKLWDNHIHMILATPTTAQPAWLSKQYPEVLPVDIAGRKRTHGMRVFFCVNSEKFRQRAAAIAEQMARRYGKHPGLIGWHVCNEYGTYCYCDNCQRKFREWLKNRYRTIEELNARWNTAFWGRIVYDFDEIMLPTELNDDYRFNPAVQLDYMRFVTDSTKECYLNEANILKKYSPNIPVFSNISGFIKKLNQFSLTEPMDCAGWDNYPSPSDDPSFPAMKHDLMRAMKDGASYYVTEQSPNQQNWQPYNKLKWPGELRTIAYQGMAHGSDSSLYFQMRQSLAGQEKFHGAFISHADTPDTRIFQEASRLGQELKKLGDVFLEGTITSKVGILFDWENWWALELTSGPTQDMDYLSQVHTYYKAFYRQNIPVDMLKLTSDLSRYRIILAPLLYMERMDIADKVKEFVRGGGIFIGTYMTGLTDENDRCVFGAYPGKYRDLFGIWVEETDALYPDEWNTMEIDEDGPLGGLKKSYPCSFLCDRIHLAGAQALAYYGKNFYAGTPCTTMHSYGQGQAYYLGSMPDDDFLKDFSGKLCEDADIAPLFAADENVEISCRENEKGKVVFLINHSDQQRCVDLGAVTYRNLLDDKLLTGRQTLNGRDVCVLQLP